MYRFLKRVFGLEDTVEDTAPKTNKIDGGNLCMNMKAINELVTGLQDELGDACLASAILSYSSGVSLASYNFDDKSSALLSKYSTFLVDTYAKVQKDMEIKYYAIKMPDSVMAFTLLFKDYCWLVVVDTAQVPLGMIMSVLLPDGIKRFHAAMA